MGYYKSLARSYYKRGLSSLGGAMYRSYAPKRRRSTALSLFGLHNSVRNKYARIKKTVSTRYQVRFGRRK